MPLLPARRPFLAGLFALLLAAGPAAAQRDAPVIATAANVQHAVEAIADLFAADTGNAVRLSFGSTGNFVRQIREGAPFEMFIAADEESIGALHADGFTRDAGMVYATGRLVVVAPDGSPLVPDGRLDTLAALLETGGITRFAIANPEHAPYGMRAREALVSRGIWEKVQPLLVLGENVSQATQFALSGNADGGIIAYSVMLSPGMADRGRYDLIPEDYHQPLRQSMALLEGAGPVAEAFYEYMQSPEARAVMERYGFALPRE